MDAKALSPQENINLLSPTQRCSASARIKPLSALCWRALVPLNLCLAQGGPRVTGLRTQMALFLQVKGVRRVFWPPFSKGNGSFCVSVSHFGHSLVAFQSFSLLLYYVICDQWSLMLL